MNKLRHYSIVALSWLLEVLERWDEQSKLRRCVKCKKQILQRHRWHGKKTGRPQHDDCTWPNGRPVEALAETKQMVEDGSEVLVK